MQTNNISNNNQQILPIIAQFSASNELEWLLLDYMNRHRHMEL